MIRQPEFVTREVFLWAMEECRRKKPELDVSAARWERFTESLCVQAMHIGPFSEEPATLARMTRYAEEQGCRVVTGSVRKHHEIYLSDPLKTEPGKLRTVLRLPVE